MGWMRFLRRSRWDDERAQELESYLAIETDDNIARGMTPTEARLAARRKLGNVTRTREVIYEMNTITLIDTIGQDLRYGARLLRRNPAFALIAILSLALGTGANTAIFQLVNAIRLRTLPVVNPRELAEIRLTDAPRGRSGSFNGRLVTMTHPLFEALQARQQAFSSVLAYGTDTYDLAAGGLARPVQALWVSGDFFRTLGTQPALGRLLTADVDRRGCPPVAVLNHAFWQREYGGAPDVLGRTVPIDRHPFTIVGVTPAGFFGLDVGRTFDVALPLCAEPIVRTYVFLDRRDGWYLATMGRLKPGWTIDQANAHLRAISPDMLAATIPPTYNADNISRYQALRFGVRAGGNGLSSVRRGYEAPLWILLGVTGLVLLIACANLANLLLARATAREREMAVRLAIGASRGRIMRQMLSESLLLATAGTAAGVLLAQWLSRFLVTFLNSEDNPLLVDLSFDWRTFGFIAALAAGACLLFGIAPAIRATRTEPGTAMKAGGRGTTDAPGGFGLRQMLVVVQVALSLVLVVSALLFVRSLRNLVTQDPGFRRDGLVLASLSLSRAGIAHDALQPTADAIIAGLRREPGLEATVEAQNVPTGDGDYWVDQILIDGKQQEHELNLTRVSPGYFKAMDIGLLAGRDFSGQDTRGAPHVAVVNEAFVATYFPHEAHPIGRGFQIVPLPGETAPVHQIVGIVKNSKYANLHDDFEPIAFLAAAQSPAEPTGLHLIVRTQLPPATVIATVTRIVTGINPGISLSFNTMRAQVDRSLQRDQLMALVSGFFGVLAAVIATLGLYGVMSYIVARRRTEIGIRMALGAEPRAVIRLITRDAALLVAIGLIAGGALAVVATRSAQSMLYGLEPWDPATLAMAIVALGGVATLASWLPARRAARLDPTSALRQE